MFTYSTVQIAFHGLNLFFNDTGVSYNPTGGSIVPGDLTVYAPGGSTGMFGVPAAGTTILSYGTDGFTYVEALANGASSMVVGDLLVSVSAFDPSNMSTFTITVSAIPEASAFLSLAGAGGLVAAATFGLRRWRGCSPAGGQSAQII
jgi:hypothetical protein